MVANDWPVAERLVSFLFSQRRYSVPPPPACVWSALDWLLVTQLSPSAFEWSGIVSLTRILLPHTTKERPSFHPYTHTFTHAYIEEQTVESSLRAAVTFFPSVWLEAARKSRCIQYFRRVPCPLSQWSVFHDCIILHFYPFCPCALLK